MLTRRLVSTLMAALCVFVVLPAFPVAAQSEPVHVPWTTLLPPAPSDYEGTRSPLCPAGQTRCVDIVIREMQRRFGPLASRCDHDAVFALTYLRTTEEYRRAIQDPAFFQDTAFVNTEDVLFADYYFRAHDNWQGGRRSSVPGAWRVAFDAADRRAVSGMGNMLLGMNAHINRDLPFVFEQIGMVRPDGSSRKPDHDRVNDFLIRVTDDVPPEIARRFDPSADDASVPILTVDETGVFQLVALWRENAWRNAERLVNARNGAERAQIAAEIEFNATTIANLIALQSGYLPPLTSTRERDNFCATHWNAQ